MMSSIKYMIAFALIQFSTSIGLAHESCDINIPAGEWSGETMLRTGGSTTKQITVSVNGSTVKVSDFSAGFFDHFGLSGHSVSLSINCDGSVAPTSISTSDVGTIEILSGQWNESDQTLTIDWNIPSNKLAESTSFSFDS